MFRVVLDPNVVISALIAPTGTTRHAVDAALSDGVDLIVCHLWMQEITAVAARERFRRWFTSVWPNPSSRVSGTQES